MISKLAPFLGLCLATACQIRVTDGSEPQTPGTTGADAAPTSGPYAGKACPSSLTISVGPRTIDGRRPKKSKGPYAKNHMHPYTAADGLSKTDAIAKVLELERKTPGLVPEPFRAELATKGQDPFYRLYMSRCEVDGTATARRAGHDAALAFLLGASNDDALAASIRALNPVKGLTNCNEELLCQKGFTCDSFSGLCSNEQTKQTEFLSQAELDVEEVLLRALVPLQTDEMREEAIMHDMPTFWPANHYARCGENALCHVSSGIGLNAKSYRDKKIALWWDRRYVGEVGPGHEISGSEKSCLDRTGFTDKHACLSKCDGDRRCEQTCDGCPYHMY